MNTPKNPAPRNQISHVKACCFTGCLTSYQHANVSQGYRLVGLVVKASTLRAEDPGFESHLHQDFLGSSHTSDIKIDTPVATVPGAWCYRVSAGTGRPGASILWLGEMESFVCNFYLSVAACKFEHIRPWDTLACCWDIKQPNNKQKSQGSA